MIIGLTGYAQSGKDTVANILTKKYGFERRAFADNVRKVLYDLDVHGVRDVVDLIGWDRAKQIQGIRQLLQNVGVAARTHIDEQVWISAVLRTLNKETNYVITDVRFVNEASAIKAMDGKVWRVYRLGIGPVNNHISETELDKISPDKIVLNSSGFDGLEKQIDNFINEL